MSSCHERIAYVGTLSYHGKMMQKDMKEGSMLKDTHVAKHTIRSIKKIKGTLVCDHNSRLKIIEYSISPSHMEVKRIALSSRH